MEHKTKVFGSTDADPGERFFFEVRNKVWMFTRSTSLSPAEKVLYGGSTARRWASVSAGPSASVMRRAPKMRGLPAHSAGAGADPRRRSARPGQMMGLPPVTATVAPDT